MEFPAETAHSPGPSQNLHPTEDESQLFSVGYYRRIATISIRLLPEPKEKSLRLEQIAENNSSFSLKDKQK